MSTSTISAAPARMVPWWLVLLQGIAAIIIGALLLISPAKTTTLLIQVLGIYWLISGIFSLISIFIDTSMWGWKLFAGVLGIIAGILVLQHPLWSTLLVPTTLVIVLGIQGLIIGVINLIQAFRGGGWGIGILGVLSIIFGLLLLFNPFMGALALPLVVGIFALVGGVVAIIQAFRLRGVQHKLEKAAEAASAKASSIKAGAVGAATAPAGADAAATRSAGDIATGAVDKTTAAAGSAAAAVTGAVASAVDTVDDAADEAVDAVVATADAAGDMVDDAVDTAAESIDDVVDAAGDAAGGAAAAAADAVSDAVDEVDDTMDAAADMAGDAVDTVAETVDDVVDAAGDAADDATRFVGIDTDLEVDVTPDNAAAVVADRFPDWSSADKNKLAALFASIRKLDLPNAVALKENGIQTLKDLLERGGTRQGRADIAKAIGSDPSTVLKWVNDADLARIKGIGVKYSDLLETAGVDTVVELSMRNPENLFQKLVDVNSETGLVEELPTASQVLDWVSQAKELPRAISY